MSMTPHGVELHCPECGHQVPPGQSHMPCARCRYGEPIESGRTCLHDPRAMVGKRIGAYHCPECGEMVLTGSSH